MRQIRKILEHSVEAGLSLRETSILTGVSKTTISEYLARFKACGLTLAQSMKLSDSELLLYLENKKEETSEEYKELVREFPEYLARLKKKGMTRQILWEDYIRKFPTGYSYSQFCHHFQIWRDSVDVCMHQDYKPGEYAFLDYTGTKFPYYDLTQKKNVELEVFVAILGASNLTYAEASENQKNERFVRSTENALQYFGGSPRALVPDNLKSAVLKADKYEPELNPLFDDFSDYYRTAIVPARARKPKDKPLVENAVRLMYQRIFAPLYGKSFRNIDEVNKAIRERLEDHNNRKLSKLDMSRRELFEQIEKDTLRTLPSAPYPLKYFELRKVAPDYHILLSADKHYYSVPWQLKGKKVKVIYDEKNVAIYADNERIVQHRRNPRPGGYTTCDAHMPKHHKFYNSWSAEKFTSWADSIGIETSMVIKRILGSKRHEQQAYKSCLGILSLANKNSKEDLNFACRKAWNYGRVSYHDVKNYLEDIIRTNTLNREDKQLKMFTPHENLRNAQVYR